jgi:hypothetical protein
MKVLRMVRSGQIGAPGAMRVEHVLGAGRALHQLEDARAGVLEGHVEVGQDLALGHQRDEVVDAGIGIDVVQAHPDAELPSACTVRRRVFTGLPPQKPVRYLTSTP